MRSNSILQVYIRYCLCNLNGFGLVFMKSIINWPYSWPTSSCIKMSLRLNSNLLSLFHYIKFKYMRSQDSS